MRKVGCALGIILWSFVAHAQDLTYCGTGYFIDLSLGYSPTGIGLELCGCSAQTTPCELVHIVMRRTSSGITDQLDCPNIVLTERWWREKKDLVDIYFAETCEELIESDTHADRYEINTSFYGPGDTLSILVCKTNFEDENIIELSASPGQECSQIQCAPQMDCPIEMRLHPNLQCQYEIPILTNGISLTDTCVSPHTDITSDFVLMQHPTAGSIVSEDLFVEIKAVNSNGEVVTTCDISVVLVPNKAPIILPPEDIPDIRAGEPFPPFEELIAFDSISENVIYSLETMQLIDPYQEEACEGYSVTYRWQVTDSCGLNSEISRTFRVLPNLDGPAFASLPADIDTIFVGEPLPLLVDLIAINPDGTTDGISVFSSIDPYLEDNCYGHNITYRWAAIDSCGDATELTEEFYVQPNGQPPVFVNIPDEIEDISAMDSLPLPQQLSAVSVNGDTSGIIVLHSVDPYDPDPCIPYEVIYRWTATDTCGLTAEVTRAFNILPDSLAGSILAGVGDLMIEVSLECTETATLEIPIDVDLHPNIVITIFITDEDWNVVDEYLYTGPEEYDFGSGLSHVIYSIENQCGAQFIDTINILAEDVSAPVFICPDFHQLIVTDFSSCSTVASWIVPQAFDNCDEVEIIQVAGPLYGSQLGVGTYDITYEAIDDSNNTSSCSFSIVVSPISNTSLTCLPFTLEIDSMCQADITKAAIIGSDILVCAPNLQVEVIAGVDTLRGDTFKLGDYYGQPIKYVLCAPSLNICCENFINLFDNISPVINCQDTVRLPCLSDINAYRPDLISECGPVTWITRDLSNVAVCNNPIIRQEIIREFIAVDQAGNRSIPCTQILQISYADIEMIFQDGRITFPGDTILNCEDYDIENVSDSIFGYPGLDSITLLIGENFCGIHVSYEDEPIFDYGCTKIIKRHWKLVEDLCGYGFREVDGVQLIRIVDTEGPTVTSLEDTIYINTSPYECLGYLKTKDLQFLDNCQDPGTISYIIEINDDYFEHTDSIPLLLGLNEVHIISQDECKNIGKDTLIVKVLDNIRPVAACLENTIISITSDQIGFPVSALDIGSYDNCELVEIKIRKQEISCSDQDTVYKTYVNFCCQDVGRAIKVLLRTKDHAGNLNYCWGLVNVQDKLAPVITCPPDLILDCTFPLSRSSEEADPYGHLFGQLKSKADKTPLPIDEDFIIYRSGELLDGTVTDNCNSSINIEITTREEINQCGIGRIYRSFIAIDQGGNKSETCTQIIEIKNDDENDSVSIEWPTLDVFVEDCKSSNSISPDILGRPTITNQECALYGISYDDTYVEFNDSASGTCNKIIRKWTVINWCENSPLENSINQSQVIKITDRDQPEFTQCSIQDLYIGNSSIDCNLIPVVLRKGAVDNCTSTEELKWSLEVDYFSNDRIELELTPESDSTGAYFKAEMPPGRHKVKWKVFDRCGNTSICEEFIIVENTAPPTPVAHGISTELSGSGQVTIWADELIIKTEHPCSVDNPVLIGKANDGFEQAKTNLTFTCNDVGSNVINIFAYRQLADSSYTFDYVAVKVDVEDNNNFCFGIAEMDTSKGIVSGLIFTEEGVIVPGVNLEMRETLSDELMAKGHSDNTGYFNLGQIKVSEKYNVNASLEGDVLNGITTLDMVLIQRHILGLNLFDSPYKIIAGDVNRDEKVSVSDILDIRRAILRVPSIFGLNDPWRFIAAEFKFFDSSHPLDDEPSGNVTVHYNESQLDMIAMKVGDVNGSARVIKTDKALNRSVEKLGVLDRKFHANESFEIVVKALKPTEIYGYQMAVSFDPSKLEILEVKSQIAGVDLGFNIDPDGIIYISAVSKNIMLEKEDHLFSLQCKSLEKAMLNESISLDTDVMSAEIYTTLFEVRNVTFQFEQQPLHLLVEQNEPNPFNKQTRITITSPLNEEAKFLIFDITGKVVVDRNINIYEGVNHLDLQRSEMGHSGLYFYSIIGKNKSETRRMVLTD